MPANTDSPSVDFNFDTFEQDDAPRPFGTVIGGKRYEALNPMDLDYREFAKAEDDAEAMFRILFPEDHEAILKNRISLAKLQAFTNRVLAHYGLGPTSGSSAS